MTGISKAFQPLPLWRLQRRNWPGTDGQPGERICLQADESESWDCHSLVLRDGKNQAEFCEDTVSSHIQIN